MEFIIFVFLIFLFIVIVTSIRQVNQYERGILFTIGKYSNMLEPGWHIVWPVIQGMQKVDIRTKAVDVPDQEAITKDNVSVGVSAVLYYKVVNSSKAILSVENFYWAISQLSQTTMRNVVGEVELNELLAGRDAIAQRIEGIIKHTALDWGLELLSVELKDIKLPESMIRTMAKVAEAQRERQATIVASEGEVVAAENLAKAALLMAETPGALHLRTLNSINDISSDQSNTIIFCLPMEVLRAVEGLHNLVQKK
jgi:regulator of protease activity HflC (stomatin/prohibitin superfamily)